MGNRQGRRRGAPRRSLVRPLVVLAAGAVASVALWRVLMHEPAPRSRANVQVPEKLTREDRQALDALLQEQQGPRP